VPPPRSGRRGRRENPRRLLAASQRRADPAAQHPWRRLPGHRRGNNPLPYLRFSRDKRGYEHTFVVHSDRRRGRSRTRILYWFRTPPGVKVGRSALDEVAIKSIEENNPDIEFDWTRILKEQSSSESAQSQRPPNVDRRSARRSQDARARPSVPAERIDLEPASSPGPSLSSPHASLDQPDNAVPFPEPEPIVDQLATLDPGITADETLTPAHARLGAEGVLRLRARHAEILARISERVADPARQDELKAQAERLNPDTWVTDDEVSAGLEGYEAVLESLRAVVGQGRRRRRRGGHGREGLSSSGAAASPDVADTAIEPTIPAASDGDSDDGAD
jgi:hypothetical protein